jgi:hypothetical protein
LPCDAHLQVRVYEKARDDYAERFNDAGLPEACVTDMLRGRAVCEEGGQLLALQRLLQRSFQVHVEGEGDAVREAEAGAEVVTLELVRTKNKCSAGAIGALCCAAQTCHTGRLRSFACQPACAYVRSSAASQIRPTFAICSTTCV